MNQYNDEDTAIDRRSSQSRKTCPTRSDFEDYSKKMRMAHSTGELNTKAFRTRDIDRNHGRVAHVKEKEQLNHFIRYSERYRYVNADGKPSGTGNYTQRNASQNLLENEDNMQVEGTPPYEDHGSGDQMDAEDVNNVQTHSSTPRKEFPAHTAFTIPSTETIGNESASSEDIGGFQRLSPLLDAPVQNLRIEDQRYHAQSMPEFTNRPIAAAPVVHPIHQNPYHVGPPTVRSSLPSLLQLDMRDGRNRLKTFEAYWPPESEFFNAKVLVSFGFYATGADDAVCCFACNATIANWEKDDDPKRRHLEVSPNCRFANGIDHCGNRPLSPVRNSKRNPAGSPGRRSHGHGRNRHQRSSRDRQRRVHPSYRTNLPSSQREPVTSRRSSLSPQRSSSHLSPPSTHQRSNSSPPESPMAQEPARVHEYENPTPSIIERNNLMENFPCQNPATPAMRELSARLRTFDNPMFRANTRLGASNSTLAEAGMYYAGQSDDTKCWYCGGGLRRYQPDDDPWVEHAKYFPECEYLLQQRGPGWIHGISVLYPNVVRPSSPMMHNLAVPQLRQPVPAPPPAPVRQPVVPVAARLPPPLPSNVSAFSPIHQGQYQATPLVIPQTQPTHPQGQNAPVSPHIPRQSPQQHLPMNPPAPPPRNLNQQPVPIVPQQPPPPPPPAPSGPQNLRTAGGAAIEDPQAMIQQREQMVEASMHTEAVQGARSMGFTEDQIRTAQMRRIVGLGGPYQTTNLLLESLLNPDTDPVALEPPQQRPPPRQRAAIRGRRVDIRNGHISITGGNFTNAAIGLGRGRSHIIIDGVPLHEYIAQMRGEQGAVAQPAVYNNVGTTVATQPYNTAPTPFAAPMNAETSTTNSNDVQSTSSTNPPEPTGTAEERLEALQKEYQCKICYSARVEVLFEPCGHICACLNCARQVTQCPMCRKRITRYIKTYHC